MKEFVDKMVQRLELAQPLIEKRDNRYRGVQPLRYLVDEVEGELAHFNVNLCRIAVNAVAERMRVKKLKVTVGGRDVSERVTELWKWAHLDQTLQSVLADALALGSAYLIVWVDGHGTPTITAESSRHVVTVADPINGETTAAVKRWFEHDHLGTILAEHVVLYLPGSIRRYERGENGNLTLKDERDNPLGVVPVVPLINFDRIGDSAGHSVIDDLGHLVDALSKVLADMLTASEAVARPKRWATGVSLEETGADGFTADGDLSDDPLEGQAVSPFEDTGMWTVENDTAKFGQLPGADLHGYRTAADLILQEIMAVSALPGHMLGVTSSNPASADAIRAAEASLTSRAESRIRVLGLAVEQAVALLAAVDSGVNPVECRAEVQWASPATRSTAQEADAVTKLHSLGIITTAEAREAIGVDAL